MRDRVRYLEKQLDEKREANRENWRIIAGLVQRSPIELPHEPASESSGSSETASEDPYSTYAPPTSETPASDAQHKRRSWL